MDVKGDGSTEADMTNTIEDWMATLPEEAQTMRPFNNDKYCGLVVSWVRRGVGFGEITISCEKETGEWAVDTEHMGPEFCAGVFEALAAAG